MKLSDFDYTLPEHLIAHQPAAERRGSRLLVLESEQNIDSQFADLRSYLQPGDLLVFNNTRVIKARVFGLKETGGKVEVFVERIVDSQHAWCMLKASKAPKEGARILFQQAEGSPHAEGSPRAEGSAIVKQRDGNIFLLEFSLADGLLDWLDQFGEIPLPPYIERKNDSDLSKDEERYQTVYGKVPGAVAAPTAGLHFDNEHIQSLRDAGIDTAEVTLHVGAGTFAPVRVDNIHDHQMHSEWLSVSEQTAQAVARTRERGGRVVAVGTTSIRALESAAMCHHGQLKAYEGDTNIFIYPGYRFHVVDALLTNFHLPQSTLLMLVSAMVGRDRIMAAYQHAIDNEYRFFSYGDAMFISYNDAADER